jgi:hypothetical protein
MIASTRAITALSTASPARTPAIDLSLAGRQHWLPARGQSSWVPGLDGLGRRAAWMLSAKAAADTHMFWRPGAAAACASQH